MFDLTEKKNGASALGEAFPPGVYEQGLLTVTNEEDSRSLAESLEWSVYNDYRVVAYNCMGDLFIQRSGSSAIGYVWLQYGYGRFIADSGESWLALLEGEGKEKFLETYAFDHLHRRKGTLPYGSVYTMAPILALGGESTLKGLDRCGVGQLDVYLSIVSQSFVPGHWGEFA